MNTKANDLQHGGAHYKGTAYQHWDLAADLNVPYQEGQITKYIIRHGRKNGLLDVQKARHFLEKLRELVVAGRRYPTGVRHAEAEAKFHAAHTVVFGPLSIDEALVFDKALHWRGTSDLDLAIAACRRIEETYAAGSGTAG